MKLNHFSLCSGIGGLDLAAEWAGFTTIAQCEIDEYASKVLAKNFKGVPNLHDIRTVTNERLAEYGIRTEDITVVSAGFPCQPYSLAGKGLGDSDERDLWGEVARVLKEIRPRWFVGENTPGLFARQNQRYFRRVLNDLTALGYRVGWGIWGACDVGAPHKRDRVFIISHSDGRKSRPRIIAKPIQTPLIKPCADNRVAGNLSDAVIERQYQNEIQRGELAESRNEKNAGRIQESWLQFERICGSIPNSCSERQIERRNRKLSAVAEAESLWNNNRGRTEKYVGREWWQTEPDVGRVANGIPSRVDRLRCLGNAVVPPQAYPIFEAIAEFELSQGEQI